MVDVDDVDDLRLFVDPVEHSVGAATGAEQVLEVTPKRLADPPWLAGQRTECELDDRGSDAGWDAAQRAPAWSGELDVVARGLAPQRSDVGTPNSALIAASS